MPPVKIPQKAKDPKKTIARLLAYLKCYQFTMVLVVLCIIVAAIAMAAGSASLGDLVDDYIKPMLSQSTPDYGPLLIRSRPIPNPWKSPPKSPLSLSCRKSRRPNPFPHLPQNP